MSEIYPMPPSGTDVVGEIRAYDGLCPHAGFALADGDVDGDVLVCPAHSWEFDLTTGAGVNPTNCRLTRHPVRLDGDQITISLSEGVTDDRSS